MRWLVLAFCLFATSNPPLYAEVESKPAPDFVDITAWLNSEPLQISELTGRVVLVDFWSYSCINCLRALPYLNRWYDTYRDHGFLIIGVHSPEFVFERDKDNVKAAIKRYGVRYPVAMDNNFATWKAYETHFWPTSYLIDQKGNIRYKHIGEGGYVEMENEIRKLLAIEPLNHAQNPPARRLTTPEIYLGSRRGKNFTNQIQIQAGAINNYSYNLPLDEDEVGIKGLWRVGLDSITSAGSECSIDLNFQAPRVYLVLSGSSPDPITLKLDDKPLPESDYTSDMDPDGQIFMDGDRKYDIVDFHGEMKRHTISIHLPPGISAYAFTFGDKV